MNPKSNFNPHQLRVGDYALVRDGKLNRPAHVIAKGRTYLSPIGVRFFDGKEQFFDSRKTGFAAIVGGARCVDGKWVAL